MNAPFFPPADVAAHVDRIHAVAARAFWDRGDGWDNNHPDAPPCWRCDQCDGFRFTDAPAFCADCDEVTGCYADPSEPQFATLAAYGRNPAPFEAEMVVNRTRANAAIDAGMSRLNEIQAARWAAEEQGEA